MMPKQLKGVIFDLDGTLCDLDVDWVGLKKKLSEMVGYEVVSMNDINHRHDLLAGPAGDLIEEYEDAGVLNGRVLPGVESTLKAVSQKYQLAVVTRNGTKAANQSMAQLGFHDIVILGRTDVARHKPHPEIIEKALDKLGFSPAEVIVVGDSFHDVEAAHAAGTRAIHVKSDHYPVPENADYYIETMHELPALLARLNTQS